MKKDYKRNSPRKSNNSGFNKADNEDFTKSKYRRKDDRKSKFNNNYSKTNKDNSFKFKEGYSRKNEYSNSQSIKTNKSNYELGTFQEKHTDDLIWGKHAVLSILQSGKPVNRIWCTSEIRSSEKFLLLLKEIKKKGTLIEEASWSRISQITYGAVHQGIVLQIAYSQTIPLSDLIVHVKKKYSRPILVILDGITDPHNLGAIIRSAEAFGCAGIVIPQRRSAGLTGTVAKVATGALENIPISRVVNLNRTLEELKNEGFIVVGLSSESSVDMSTYTEESPLVIVIGSENKGLSLLIQRNCDFLLKIPLKGKTSSLNASVAAAISFYHFQ